MPRCAFQTLAPHLLVYGWQLARQAEHQTDRQICHALVVRPRAVGHHHAASLGRVQVNVIHADAVHADHFELGGMGEDTRRQWHNADDGRVRRPASSSISRSSDIGWRISACTVSRPASASTSHGFDDVLPKERVAIKTLCDLACDIV